MALSEQHIAAIAEIEALCFSSPWSKRSIHSYAIDKNAVFAMLDHENGYYLGIGDGQKAESVVAYCLWLINPWEQLAELLRIAVRPEKQGQRLAEQLIQKTEAYFHGQKDFTVERLLLEVSVANLSAVHIYNKMGFCKISHRRKYYNDGSDALIMQKICGSLKPCDE